MPLVRLTRETLRVCGGFIFLTCIFLYVAPSNAIEDDIYGKWEITSKPRWVVDNYLAFRSDTYVFTRHGTCLWGQASGKCEILDSGTMAVSFPMQNATPGYAGVFEYKVEGGQLVLRDTVRPEPIILQRWLDFPELVSEVRQGLRSALRSERIDHKIEELAPDTFAIHFSSATDYQRVDKKLDEVFNSFPKLEWNREISRDYRVVPTEYSGSLTVEIHFIRSGVRQVYIIEHIRPHKFSAVSVGKFFSDLQPKLAEIERASVTIEPELVSIHVGNSEGFNLHRNIAKNDLTGGFIRRYVTLVDKTKEYVIELQNADETAGALRVRVIWGD